MVAARAKTMEEGGSGGITALLQAERERWILWSPVALGSGIALYFALPCEPWRWVGPLLLGLCLSTGIAVRRRPPWLPALAFVFALAGLGFTLAGERSRAVAAPVLSHPTQAISIVARITEVEPLEQGVHRFVLDRVTWPELRGTGPLPVRLRVRLRESGGEWRPGQRVALRVVLMPPPAPASPGAYDFSRQAWFLGIGAVGYAAGPPRLLPDADQGEGWERIRLFIAGVRRDLTERIVAAVENGGLARGVGWVAAALITAERGPVSPDLLQAYRDAGLAHILVIAGMHMSMVAGLVFMAIRGGLAMIPWIALRYPIKKWTAGGALLITFCYLIISGAPVPTQRAFMMNGIVLVAILFDREAISLRSITWAALLILLLRPEALMGASFQMSFAAVYGLIAGYEAIGPAFGRWRARHRGRWSTPFFYVAGILLTTQIAGTATAFYTIFHFNRYATYGLLGNFLAVPVVGFWVMPAALLAFCLMPFGLDAWAWWLMGRGIVAVSDIAQWVSALPGASVDLPAMPVSALVLFTLGGFWLLLWRRRWRLWGLAGMAAAIALYALHRPPDVLIAPSGLMMAGRDGDGRLLFSRTRSEKMLRETWVRQAGQGTAAVFWRDGSKNVMTCDGTGCVYRREAHLLAFLSRPERLPGADCRGGEVVIVAAPVARDVCPGGGRLIDGDALRRGGTHAFWLDAEGWRIETVDDWQGARPWNHIRTPIGGEDASAAASFD
ncbi:ComEC/Rec2 family competence protein [Telmatospirillum siberiense]|uniref:ComEC/Rec2 family competence protein n=1 Tax=Telmatospirillum siberiense TaxID=382514 RepID=UPI0013043F3E|nr:ComEC/Rec2 family competence protein [Telmatospirillum siberiense]